MTARLLDALRRLDERVVPTVGQTLDGVHAPRWVGRTAERANDVDGAVAVADRIEQRLYVGWSETR